MAVDQSPLRNPARTQAVQSVPMQLHRVDGDAIEGNHVRYVPGSFEQHVDFVLPDDDGHPLTVRENLSLAAIGLTVIAIVSGLMIAVASFRG